MKNEFKVGDIVKLKRDSTMRRSDHFILKENFPYIIEKTNSKRWHPIILKNYYEYSFQPSWLELFDLSTLTKLERILYEVSD